MFFDKSKWPISFPPSCTSPRESSGLPRQADASESSVRDRTSWLCRLSLTPSSVDTMDYNRWKLTLRERVSEILDLGKLTEIRISITSVLY